MEITEDIMKIIGDKEISRVMVCNRLEIANL